MQTICMDGHCLKNNEQFMRNYDEDSDKGYS